MDTSSTLLGIGLLMAFIAPVGYLLVDQSRREKARMKTLLAAASRLHLELSKTEILTGLYLGLDENQQKLLAITPEKKKSPEVMNLKDSKVTLLKKYHKDHSTASIDELRTVVLQIDSQKSSTSLNFYQADSDPVTEKGLRLQKAMEWEKLLQDFQKRK